MKKMVLKLDIHDDKEKQKCMRVVSGLLGVESISIDMKEKKLTVTGNVDPIEVVSKLRKICHTEVLIVGPVKEEKKVEGENGGDKKKEEEKKKEERQIAELIKAYKAHNPYMTHYYVVNPDENSSTCVIC